MSTHEALAIPFSLASEYSNFRLLELPEELVKLLSSANPPHLQFKSEASSANAVLCTESSTFPLRQVHTSNSLFIIEPDQHVSEDPDTVLQDGYCAIASCGATLEMTPSTDTALTYLRKTLPAYSRLDVDVRAAAGMQKTMSSIAADIPLSDGEIDQAWTELCAFADGGSFFRPIAAILLSLWQVILAASVAENIDLSSSFLMENVWALVQDEEYPKGMFKAVMRRVARKDQTMINSESQWMIVDKQRCSTWVACLILETHTRSDQTLSATKLLELWRDNLPESWRDQAEIALLQEICTQPSATTVLLKPTCRLAAAPVHANAENNSSKAGKWHEKFKKARG